MHRPDNPAANWPSSLSELSIGELPGQRKRTERTGYLGVANPQRKQRSRRIHEPSNRRPPLSEIRGKNKALPSEGFVFQGERDARI